tara:strand:- start:198 stop:320 length:123 start_codon:yes stop_codon:yes gene_type:complete
VTKKSIAKILCNQKWSETENAVNSNKNIAGIFQSVKSKKK